MSQYSCLAKILKQKIRKRFNLPVTWLTRFVNGIRTSPFISRVL